MRTKRSYPSTSSNTLAKNSEYCREETAGTGGDYHIVIIKEEHLKEDENFDDNVTSTFDKNNHEEFVEKDKLENLSLVSDSLDPKDSSSKAPICNICHVLIETDELMNQHKKIHELVESICDTCETKLPSQYDLLLHKRNAHEDTTTLNVKYFCKKCATFYGNEEDLGKHERGDCVEELHRCKYCSHQCNTKLQLTVHLRKHYDVMMTDPMVEKWTCETCGKVFVDKMYYEQHRYTHDAKYTKQFHCIKCNIFFSSAIELNNHKLAMAHDEVETCRCDICHKEFLTRRNMLEHRRMHKKMCCDHCGIRFTKTKLLNDHLQQEHKLPPKLVGKYVCKVCGKDFFKPRLLQDHKNTHSGKAPYNCEQCHKDFRTYTAKWVHEQTHSNNGFFCHHCNQKFSNKTGLRRHIIKFHAEPDQWKHECQICKKKFAVKTHLWNHMKQDHPQPFTCDVCGNNFAKKPLLKKHQKRHVKQEIK